MRSSPAQLPMGTEKMSSDAKATIPGIQKTGTYQSHRQCYSENVHAYILLIDNDFKVLKTNYYQLTGTQKSLEEKRVGDLLQCRNALSAEGGCGTHAYCGSCPIRCAIRQAFEQRRGFTDLEATLNVLTAEKNP